MKAAIFVCQYLGGGIPVDGTLCFLFVFSMTVLPITLHFERNRECLDQIPYVTGWSSRNGLDI